VSYRLGTTLKMAEKISFETSTLNSQHHGVVLQKSAVFIEFNFI